MGAQGHRHRRERDAGPDEDEGDVRRLQASEGRPHRRMSAHDAADGRAHRDAHRARSGGLCSLRQSLFCVCACVCV